MLAGLLYNDTLPFFNKLDHHNGLFPDDVLDVLDGLGIHCKSINKLPKRQPALVAIEWREKGFGGHFVVWDPIRKQFLDPLYGLIGQRDFLSLCNIEHIWSTGKQNMRQLVKARVAKVLAKELFKPFGNVAIGLGRMVNGNFTIQVRFASTPPKAAYQIKDVRGIPIEISVTGGVEKKEDII
jgi:hypothetical protein